MTAEVTIMNRMAVAMAADSAVTVGDRNIYNSANKLFMLSKYHPVGILVYAAANFMKLPWETIIKLFRKNLGQKSYNSVKEYADAFKKYVEGNRWLFPETLQDQFAKGVLKDFFEKEIKNRTDNAFRQKLINAIQAGIDSKDPKFPTEKEAVAEEIEKILKEWEELKLVPNFSSIDKAALRKKYENFFDEVIKASYKTEIIDSVLNEKIIELMLNFFLKDQFYCQSGIVIAGFGEKDVYPSFTHFQADYILENKLKYVDQETRDISPDTPACIRFFAQDDMGMAFLYGIDPELEKQMNRNLWKNFVDVKRKMVDDILKITDPAEKKRLEDELDKLIRERFRDYRKSFDELTLNGFTGKIYRTVSTLPKDELGTMAETLVNLTSFKRKVHGDPETVGGPIDVAIITKGDGFIWIKRKHYFQPELNAHFLKNYFEEGQAWTETEKPSAVKKRKASSKKRSS